MKKFTGIVLLVLILGAQTTFAQLFGGGNDFYANTISSPELYLENAKKIAILNFQDENNKSYNYWNDTKDNGGKVADYLIANLLLDSYGLNKERPLYIQGFRTNLYTVVERSQLDNVLKEQKLGASGAIGDSEASQAGKLLGIDVIVSGGVSYSHKDSKSQSSTKDEKTGKVTYSYTVNREVYAEVRVKIIKVESGQVLAVKNFKRTQTDSKNSSSPLSYDVLTIPDQLADRAFSQLAGDIMKYMTPVYQYQQMEIYKIKNKEFKDQARDAVDFMKDGKIDKALAIYAAIYEKDSYSPEIANNLAALYEGTGNFEKSLELYKVAAELDASNKDYKAGVLRAENGIKLKKYLEAYGITIAPYDFAAAGSGDSKLADKIKTRGKSKDRYEVKETQDAGSSVVAKVPGDTEFEILEKGTGWYKIKLLGGKSGYILAGDVRD